MESILQAEICQQPSVIANLIQSESENVAAIVRSIKDQFKYIVIAARGTSDNAARYAQYLLGSFNHIQVALATPSLFTLYDKVPDLSHALVIGISQSGQSPDIVAVLAEANNQNRPTLAITNDIRSPLATCAQHIIPLHASKEQAVAATKTYTSSLAALVLLSCYLENDQNRLKALNNVPGWIQSTIDGLAAPIQRAERYRFMEHCAVIGRGFNYATAFEIALKVKELTRVVAEPYSSADFRHGPIATVTPGFPVLLVAPRGAVSKDMQELIQQLVRLGAELLVISDDADILKIANLPLPIASGVPEWLSPLVSVVPGQLFGLNLAVARNLNPDKPEGLHKVTETL